MESVLTDVEVRVLGALIEKEMTTPLSYPLTLNALANACNQKSNRFPTTQYEEDTVLKAIDSLRDKTLAETVFPGSSRVAKYKHNVRICSLRFDKKAEGKWALRIDRDASSRFFAEMPVTVAFGKRSAIQRLSDPQPQPRSSTDMPSSIPARSQVKANISASASAKD